MCTFPVGSGAITGFSALARALPLVLAFGSGAAASPLVLDFDFDSRGYGTVIAEARAAGVDIVESNHGLYVLTPDVLVLGNDGLRSFASLVARPGHVFDAVSVDIAAFVSDLRFVSCAGFDTVTLSFAPDETLACSDPVVGFFLDDIRELSAPTVLPPQLTFEGQREGSGDLVRATVTPTAAGPLDIAALGDFSGLTRLTVSIIETSTVDDAVFNSDLDGWVSCGPVLGSAGCGLFELDDMVLDIHPVGASGPTPVPLPAAAGLLAAAMTVLGLTRRRG